jgi:hypothetical protein
MLLIISLLQEEEVPAAIQVQIKAVVVVVPADIYRVQEEVFMELVLL